MSEGNEFSYEDPAVSETAANLPITNKLNRLSAAALGAAFNAMRKAHPEPQIGDRIEDALAEAEDRGLIELSEQNRLEQIIWERGGRGI